LRKIVSDTALETNYIPEEHAPDPVISHGDPTAPGKIAIWLFLASEIMFFVAILGSYIILRAGSPHLFSEHAAALSKPLAGVNTIVLIFSSLTMALGVEAAQRGDRRKVALFLLLTVTCAASFLCIKFVEYADKYHHHTIVTKEKGQGWVYDGHVEEHNAREIVLKGFRMPLGAEEVGFNAHLASKAYVAAHPEGTNGKLLDESEASKRKEEEFKIPAASVNTDLNYMPQKNIFFSCYFTLTAIHGLHVLAGMIPLSILLIQSLRGKLFPRHTEYVGLYWHFVDLVWIFLFPLLYLI
jgi:cytochrome c oxidase subunit 3